MPYFFKLSERDNKDGTLNINWVRKFIDVISAIYVQCNWICFILIQNKKHKIITDTLKLKV